MNQREAKARRQALVPQLRHYGSLERVLWPIVTATAEAGYRSPVLNTDSRGHRMTRAGDEVARSDSAPPDAAFLLGGSYAFGVGAATDEGTLPSSLWRRTGQPYVNLGLRAANSAQELASALPFVERRTTFVVCSGLNNFSTARGAPGLDPLFGPMHHEAHMARLASVPITRLARLAGDPLAYVGDRALRRELARRRRARWARRLRPYRRLEKRIRGRFAAAPPEPEPAPAPPAPTAKAFLDAAARQLRDLRLLRRLVPAEARVVFALQPLSLYTRKQLSAEEEELFAALDVLQPNRWPQLRLLLETHWREYAVALERGCAELGVPFADLSRGDYRGWCFVDRVHMTDHGHDSAAAMLEQMVGR
ncbi:MAG TPA: hypothetical protein VFA24_08345 [Gaiellaceae bacterium]|nr:hypothetical protein [Gaiellaceae bacterium]